MEIRHLRRWKILIPLFIVVLLHIPQTEQRGDGAPNGACINMTPSHSGIEAQSSAPPYIVTTSSSQVRQGDKIQVKISSPTGAPIGGFLLQAREIQKQDNVLGKFVTLPDAETHFVNCLNGNDSVTHNTPAAKQSLSFEWEAPRNYLGAILFRATIAQGYAQFWKNVDSNLVEVVTPETVVATTPQLVTSRPTTFVPTLAAVPESKESVPIDPIYDGCENNKLCHGSVEGCIQKRNCPAVVAVFVAGVTDSPLCRGCMEEEETPQHVLMECRSVAEQRARILQSPASVPEACSNLNRLLTFWDSLGWLVTAGVMYTHSSCKLSNNPAYVAAGLSSDRFMGDDSGMECQQVNGVVTLHSSWTFPKVDPYVTRENIPQDILQRVSTSYKEGKLYCKFTRDVRSTVKNVNFDLSQDKYHLMIVAGSSLKENNRVGFHNLGFVANENPISLASVGVVKGPSKLLLRLHGCFMVLAWIGSASCGILLARYFRQTWVGRQLGGKDIWFAWHRIFMVLTWLLTMAGFILILIEAGGWSGTGDNPHAITGLVTIIICFLQPIGAYFRPHPNTPKRPIFNWLHWLGGNVAHILGIVTIFFAVYLFKAELPGWSIWILVAFVVFHVIMHLMLSVAVCISDGRISNGRVNSFPMKDMNTRHSAPADRKMDSPHAGFRKFILGLYFFFIILFVVALICIIALAPIEKTLDEVKSSLTDAMGSNNNN